jgi:hypothetical protein
MWFIKRNRLCLNPFFIACLFFFSYFEGDRLSPPEGEAACGEHPLDPIFYQPCQAIAIGGMPEAAGVEARLLEPPRAIASIT